jgi:hypothetical protein
VDNKVESTVINCCNNDLRDEFDKNISFAHHSNKNNNQQDDSVSHRRQYLKQNKMVAKQEVPNINNNNNINNRNSQQEMQNENDEDLKYGHGFVSKLRNRYLSLTLRQTTVSKQRPSILDLRRTTSLNNLLDDDDDEEVDCASEDVEQDEEIRETSSATMMKLKSDTNNCKNGISNNNNNINNNINSVHSENLKNNHRNGIDKHTNNGSSINNNNVSSKLLNESYPPSDAQHHHQQQHISIRSSRSVDKNLNIKRARSVETILRYDTTAWDNNNHHQQQKQNINDVTIEDKIHSVRERPYNAPPKRLTSLIDDDERPPPGICKQTMRIFEASANKKRNVQNRPIGQEIANKMAIFKSQQETNNNINSKPAITAKKPNIIARTSSPKPTTPTTVNNNINNSNHHHSSNNNNNHNAMNNSEKYAKYAKEKTVLPKLDINIIKNNLETKSNSSSTGSWSPAENKDAYRSVKLDYSPANSDSSLSSTPNILSPYRNSMSPQMQNEPIAAERNNHKKLSATNDPSSPSIISSLSNKLSNLHMDITSTPKSSSIIAGITPTSISTGVITNTNTNTSSSHKNNLFKTIDDSECEVNGDKESSDNNKINNNVIVESKGSELKCVNDDVCAIAVNSKTVNLQPKVINNNNNNNQSSLHSAKLVHEKSASVTSNANSASEMMSGNNADVKMTKENQFVITKPTTKPPPPPVKKLSRDNGDDMNNSKSSFVVDSKNSDNESSTSSSSTSSSSSSTNATTAPKWTVKKKSWSTQSEETSTNSIVFNFSDRKDVPDYIEHDGLILRRKRELPKVSYKMSIVCS